MHGLPVRVVAVTNVDVWFMSRRTPSIAYWGGGGPRRLGVRGRLKVLPVWDRENFDHRRSGNSEKASILLSR